MEQYNPIFSEQPGCAPETWPDAPPISLITPHERARALSMLMRRARECVGDGGGPDLISRMDFILKHARDSHLPASIYEKVWGLRCIFADHIISRNETNPGIAGDLA